MRPEKEGPRHPGGGDGGAGSSGADLSSGPKSSTLVQAAASYGRRRLRIFPCAPNEKRPHPRLAPSRDGQPGGFYQASSELDIITDWWWEEPRANIGLPTGQPWPDDPALSLVVLDLDVKHRPDLRPRVDAILNDQLLRRETWVARTPSGGAHIYALARKPAGIVLLEDDVGPIGELRGSGGYVLAPPSVVDGAAYKWLSPLAEDGLPEGRPLVVDDALAWARALLGEYGIEVRAKGGAEGVHGRREWQWDGEPVPEGRRHNHLVSLAGKLRSAGLSMEAVEAALVVENERRCSPPLPVAEVKRIARSMDNYPPYPNFPGNGSRADAPPAAALERQAEDTFTDAANARALAALLEDKALFVDGWGWCVWQGDRWVRDPQGAITLRLAREHLPRYYLLEALATPSQERRVEMTERAIKVQARARLEAALHLARGDLYARADDFDADPWALNTPCGIIDLRTGQIRRRTPRDRVTRLTGASPPQDGRPWHEHAPTWAAFLKRVLPDPEVRAFVQRAAGYCLTGDVSEQVLFFLHGPGGNGKTTFIRALQAALGDYATQAAPELLLTKLGERHPTEIADLKGARLVATIEVEEGRRLAESLVKWLTGGDKLKARFMRQDFFEFEPTAKFWLVANHKPVVRGSDYAIWRRILLVPFGVTIPEGERDPRLLEKLRAELGGILLWALEGLQEWQAKGLAPPPAVRRATDEYRREMDLLGDWLDERTITDPAALTPFKALYEDYVEWCRAAGELALGQRSFGNRLNERGFAPATMADGKTRARRGLRLRDNDPPPSARPAECAQHRGLTGGESHLPGVNPTTSSAQSGKSGKADANKLAAGARRQAFEEEGAGGLLGAKKGGEEAGAGPIIKEGAAPPPEGPPHPPQPCPRCQPAGMPGYYTCERGEEVTLLRVGIDRGQHILRSRQAICFNSGLLRAIEPDFLVVSFTDGGWGWVTLATARKLGHEGEFGAERQLAVPLGAFNWEAAQGWLPDKEEEVKADD